MQGVGPTDGTSADRSDVYAARRRRGLRGSTSANDDPRRRGGDDDPKSDDDDDAAWLGLEHTSEETRALYNPEARRVCLRAAVAEVAFGVLLLVSFWAAYGWSIVVAGTSIVLGTVGYSHYQTPDSVASNTCCCRPVSFIHQQTYMHLLLGAMSLASVASSIVAAVLASSTTMRVFAVIAAVASIGTGISALASHVFSADLVAFCVSAQADLENAHVIMVQPGGGGHHGQHAVQGHAVGHDGGAFATAGHAGMQGYPNERPPYDAHQHRHQQPTGPGPAFAPAPAHSPTTGAGGYGANPYAPQLQGHPQQQHHQPWHGAGGAGNPRPVNGAVSWQAQPPPNNASPYATGPHGYPPQPSPREVASPTGPTAMVAPAGTAIAPVQPAGLPPGAFVVFPVNAASRANGNSGGDTDAAVAVPVAAAEEAGAEEVGSDDDGTVASPQQVIVEEAQ